MPATSASWVSPGTIGSAHAAGVGSTPLVIDGVMCATSSFGRVYALDAASGKELWTYDPHSDGRWARYACC